MLASMCSNHQTSRYLKERITAHAVTLTSLLRHSLSPLLLQNFNFIFLQMLLSLIKSPVNTSHPPDCQSGLREFPLFQFEADMP